MKSIRAKLLVILCIITFPLQAQKPAINLGVLGNWPAVGTSTITSDGNYALFDIENIPAGKRTLVLKSTQSKWEIKVPDASTAIATSLSADSKFAMFLKGGDSLGIVKLGTSQITYTPGVRSFKIPKNAPARWIAYALNTPENNLILRDLNSGKERKFPAVSDYLFDGNGKSMLILTETKTDSIVSHYIDLVDLSNENIRTIWKGTQASAFTFDAGGNQLAFVVRNPAPSSTDGVVNSIWYYKSGSNEAKQSIDDLSSGIDSNLEIEDINYLGFSHDGRKLFINLKEKRRETSTPDAVKVDIWSYLDTKLQSLQLSELDRNKMYLAMLDVSDNSIVRLEYKNETAALVGDDFFMITRTAGEVGPGERWNSATLRSYYFLFIKNLRRKLIKEHTRYQLFPSPEGKYAVYFENGNCFSINVSTGITQNITERVHPDTNKYTHDEPYVKAFYRVASWVEDDDAIMLYDQSDIWLLDLSGKANPINITNEYGRKNGIIFRLATNQMNAVFTSKDTLILSAFDRTTKDNGFFSQIMGKKSDPQALIMGKFMFYAPDNEDSEGAPPVKAKNAKVYLVKRMGATESPNYFATSDFRTFTELSSIYPEREYNWMTSELITWKKLDGNLCQGVLYRPESYDTTQKYPVIFNIYDKKSQLLNEYLSPGPCTGNMNTPWFVSNGYWVFTPDIHHIKRKTKESVLNSIESAVRHLSLIKGVDTERMGIQGFSFGGYQVYDLITHTKLFSAASAGGGITDLVSYYGCLLDNGTGFSAQEGIESQQLGTGAAPWEDPEVFIKNSPIFHVDQISTPLLMLNNKQDGAVNFSQALELFTALRRLGKKAWLLQYDNGAHGVWGREAIDYTIRMTQFFDHYLKGEAAPKWMTRGIPASLKEVNPGYELDREIVTPGAGLFKEQGRNTSKSGSN